MKQNGDIKRSTLNVEHPVIMLLALSIAVSIASYSIISPPISCWLPAFTDRRAMQHYSYFMQSGTPRAVAYLDSLRREGIPDSQIDAIRRDYRRIGVLTTYHGPGAMTIHTDGKGGTMMVSIGSCCGADIEHPL